MGLSRAVPCTRVGKEVGKGWHQCKLHNPWIHTNRGLGERVQGLTLVLKVLSLHFLSEQ